MGTLVFVWSSVVSSTWCLLRYKFGDLFDFLSNRSATVSLSYPFLSLTQTHTCWEQVGMATVYLPTAVDEDVALLQGSGHHRHEPKGRWCVRVCACGCSFEYSVLDPWRSRMLLCKTASKHKTISAFVSELLFCCHLFVLPSLCARCHLQHLSTHTNTLIFFLFLSSLSFISRMWLPFFPIWFLSYGISRGEFGSSYASDSESIIRVSVCVCVLGQREMEVEVGVCVWVGGGVTVCVW